MSEKRKLTQAVLNQAFHMAKALGDAVTNSNGTTTAISSAPGAFAKLIPKSKPMKKPKEYILSTTSETRVTEYCGGFGYFTITGERLPPGIYETIKTEVSICRFLRPSAPNPAAEKTAPKPKVKKASPTKAA